MKPLTEVRGMVCVCVWIYKYINPSSGSLVVVVRMASSQISCFYSISLCLSLPRLCERNVPLSGEAPTAGPLGTELLSKTTCKGQETGDWELETRAFKIPPQTVYDHLHYSQKLLLPHYFFVSSRSMPRSETSANTPTAQAFLSYNGGNRPWDDTKSQQTWPSWLTAMSHCG